ncbi:MAG: hypothetical protein U0835_03985 [Isosphaeraceae bacterium]
MQKHFPGLVVLDARHARYAPDAFVNADHLGLDGAVTLSRDLGELFRRFRRRPPSSQWVELPRFRPLAGNDRSIAAQVDVYRVGASATVSR